MKIKTSDLEGLALDWAVAKCEGYIDDPESWLYQATHPENLRTGFRPSLHWAHGGPIIEKFNITIIRADDDYEVDAKGFITNKRIPQWFAETDKWIGHTPGTRYEGEPMEPTFMIAESGGHYGASPLIAAMRTFVAHKIGSEIDIPDELIQQEEHSQNHHPRMRP